MEYSKMKAILDATLRRPTAQLSESEAYERTETLRQRDHHFVQYSRATDPRGPAGREFCRDWERMMERENES